MLAPGGQVVLNDLDPVNARFAADAVRGAAQVEVRVVHGNFADLPARLIDAGIVADHMLADLGFASNQVDDPERGLSFRNDGPLDMRLDPAAPVTAAELVATLSEQELTELIREFGEERHARRIAQKVVAARAEEPINSTTRLASIVRDACPRTPARGAGPRIDPATRTFQALRIAVNDEIGSLLAFLRALTRAVDQLERDEATWIKHGTRIAILTFHSLEDRPVKRAFSALADSGNAEVLTRRPLRAGEDEVSQNPRARSAKLRAIQIR